MKKLSEALCQLEWSRVVDGSINKIFVGGILTSEGKISNNRTALNTTTEEIKKILKITTKEIEQVMAQSDNVKLD